MAVVAGARRNLFSPEIQTRFRIFLAISTSHKAKGREWSTVAIGHDYRQPKVDERGRPGAVPKAEARLAYVAVTRAQKVLDRGGLDWIDDQLAGGSRRSPWKMSDGSSDFAFWHHDD